MDQPIYLFFGLWVEARQFARDRGLEIDRDVVPTGVVSRARSLLLGTNRRIVLTRGHFPIPESRAEELRALSEHARALNATMGHDTEVINA